MHLYVPCMPLPAPTHPPDFRSLKRAFAVEGRSMEFIFCSIAEFPVGHWELCRQAGIINLRNGVK